jgi:hypothetical protein
MRVALKTMVIIWGRIVVASFVGLVCLAPSYGVDGAFSQALHGRPDPDLQYWFHWLELLFVIGLIATVLVMAYLQESIPQILGR